MSPKKIIYPKSKPYMDGEFRMNTQQAISKRIQDLCNERGLSLHGLSILSAVPPSTLKNIVKGESKNPGTVTVKKLCDDLQITLGEFFNHNTLSIWGVSI